MITGGVQVCVGLMTMSIILDLQMQVLRWLLGTFKEMENTVDNWKLVKFPGYCEGHQIYHCGLRVTV